MPQPSAPLLEGVRVVDCTVARAGPTCVRQLADQGADVVRIVQPGRLDLPGLEQRRSPQEIDHGRAARHIGFDLIKRLGPAGGIVALQGGHDRIAKRLCCIHALRLAIFVPGGTSDNQQDQKDADPAPFAHKCEEPVAADLFGDFLDKAVGIAHAAASCLTAPFRRVRPAITRQKCQAKGHRRQDLALTSGKNAEKS